MTCLAFSSRLLAAACLVACLATSLAAAREPAREQAMAEIAALLHSAIIRCWNVPPGDGLAAQTVRLRFALRRDGSLDGEPQVVDPKDDARFAMLAASARRAVLRCAPYKGLVRYARFYEDWRAVALNFTPPQ